ILRQDVAERAHQTARRIKRSVKRTLKRAREAQEAPVRSSTPVLEASRLRRESEQIAAQTSRLCDRSKRLLEEIDAALHGAAARVENSRRLLWEHKNKPNLDSGGHAANQDRPSGAGPGRRFRQGD